MMTPMAQDPMESSRPTVDAPGAPRFDHGLRRQAVVESLLLDIVQRKLEPGSHLVTQTLADRFGMSHTPIREALIALAGIGVVDILPNKGTVVRKVGPREIREICNVRRTLECEAVRGACGRIPPHVLEGFRADFSRLTECPEPSDPGLIRRARDLDSKLHDAIAGACGNAFLAKELSRLTTLFRAFRDAAWQREGTRGDTSRIMEEAKEHAAIVEALASQDRREAVKAMARHIRSGSRTWCAMLRKRAGSPARKPRRPDPSSRNPEP